MGDQSIETLAGSSSGIFVAFVAAHHHIPSQPLEAPTAVIFGFSGVTVHTHHRPPPTAHRPSAIGHQRSILRVDCGIWYAQAHSKPMLWQPRSPRTAAKSVTRRSALPPAASPPEGLRTASAAAGGGVNPPKETSQVTQIGSGSRRGCQSRESLSGPSRSLCSRRSRIQDTARPKPPKHACRCATRNTDQIRLTGCHVLYHPHADILPARITPPTASMPRKWIGASACVPRRRRPHLVGIGLTCVCVHVCVCMCETPSPGSAA